MPTPNNTINDNDVLHGSIPITIGANTFETDDFNMDPEIVEFMRTSSKGIGNGRVAILTNRKGTATLMFPTSATPIPVFGDSFSVTLDTIVYACTVTKVGRKRQKAAESKIPIEFNVNFGTVALSVAT